MFPEPSAGIRRTMPRQAQIGRWQAPDGWVHRRFDWPAAAPRGRLLVQGGRADFIEKNLEVYEYLVARGWSVTAFDWRGQGRSGRLADDPHLGHLEDFALLADDLAGFWEDWRREADGPVAAIGHSMGGYLVLRGLIEHRIDPAAAVLVAPMLGINSPVGSWAGRRIARWMARPGIGPRAAWRQRDTPAAVRLRQRLLTSDAERFADEGWWYAADPGLRTGPPSWHWLAGAFDATAAIVRDPRVATVTTPVLMLVAEADRLVSASAALAVGRRLPNAEVVRFGRGAGHELLRESDGVRRRAYAAIDDFLAGHAR